MGWMSAAVNLPAVYRPMSSSEHTKSMDAMGMMSRQVVRSPRLRWRLKPIVSPCDMQSLISVNSAVESATPRTP